MTSHPKIQCHYEVLGVPLDADASTIKKHHRKMVLKYHPDKNVGDDSAADRFLIVQQAYECLSDPQERAWYDDHRDAILAGWSASGGGYDDDNNNDMMNMLFDVVPFMHPGCYHGYHSKEGGFYEVYKGVFESIVACERRQTEKSIELPTDFGDFDTEWSHILHFYEFWGSFGSALNFSWADKYNVLEDAPDRRIRRLMEEDNKKLRRTAKKIYNQDILALVAFVKRRDPRVKAKQEEMEQQKLEQEQRQKEQVLERKLENLKAKEAWMEQGQIEMDKAVEEDRLAGRVRLADLEDDYDYGGGKKRRGKKKKGKKKVEEEEKDGADTQESAVVPAESDAIEAKMDVNGEPIEGEPAMESQPVEESTKPTEDTTTATEKEDLANGALHEDVDKTEIKEEPAVLRCECCRRDFNSEGQMQNHVKSKKHKEAFKRYQAKLKKQEEERLAPKIDKKDEADTVEPPVEKKRERKKKRWQKVEEEEKDKAEVMPPPVEQAASDAKKVETDDSGELVMEGAPVKENKEPTEDTKATEQDLGDFEVDPAKGALDDVLRVDDDDDDDDDDDEYTESEEEPDVWRCECCRKEFRSEAQMENHMKSKKHKEAFKKHQTKEELMAEMIDDLDLES